DRDRRLPGGVYRILLAEDDLPAHLVAFLRQGMASDQTEQVEDPGDADGQPDGDDPSSRDGAPEGYLMIGEGTADDRGELRFEVFSHARYCFEELRAPDGYVLDPELRCTDGLLTASNAAPVELPEHPIPIVSTDVEGAVSPPSGPLAGS